MSAISHPLTERKVVGSAWVAARYGVTQETLRSWVKNRSPMIPAPISIVGRYRWDAAAVEAHLAALAATQAEG